MYNNKRFLAVILARGGSKRLPQKNILDLNGKELIGWTIEAGLKSKYIDTVLVSSDNLEILEISARFGAEIIKRPKELSSDMSTSSDAMEHAVMSYGESYDFIILLQPTSPLRTEKHIDEAIELLNTKQASAIISVCEMDHSPLWSNVLPDNRSMVGFLSEEVINKRSQDLEKYYRLNGAIYICDKKVFLEQKSFFIKKNIYSYIMDRECSVDIDEEIDLKYARTYMLK